ncbi:transposase family protein [Okeania sp. KiyG1]|uniref:transposase family protein n=1 Tax=Okeania sp. KiyG1 TaxID=2720165 RepID=UPI00198AD628|nr:transposase family protein [Okeania sp. KiyG1]GGA24143.1 hypothetical protein CYANOKiyG1_39650 [Okeania sp. KiyG1]
MSKNQIITTPKGTEIVDVIVGEKGPVSDVKILRKQQDKFDKKQKFQYPIEHQSQQSDRQLVEQ